MLVAKYWAEAKLKSKVAVPGSRKTPVTIKRLGWSNTSQEEAEQLAQQRAQEAMEQAVANANELHSLVRQEHSPAQGYNGADGLPIREEVVEVQGDMAITRNSYGALCLNTPDVMFVDLDDDCGTHHFFSAKTKMALGWFSAILIWICFAYLILGYYFNMWAWNHDVPENSNLFVIIIIFFVAFFVTILIGSFCVDLIFSFLDKIYQFFSPPLSQIDRFAKKNSQWRMNLYRTAAGYRLLILHQKFDPADPAIWEPFKSLGVDPVYQRMCQLQKCFRARLTPKPWRMGVGEKIMAGRRVWFAHYANDLRRIQWIRNYERQAENYAVCQLVKQYGVETSALNMSLDIQQVVQWHDEMCKVGLELPLA